MKRAGLALIVVVGVLGVLAVLATAFVTMAQLERKASLQRVNAVKASLLARSGIEDALARLGMGQEPNYLGEDWDASGTLNGPEIASEVYHPGILDTDACPVRQAMRPSFFAADPSDPARKPLLVSCDGRQRGYSGRLQGDMAAVGNHYALKVADLNALIHINGGALDGQDRDPDGPASPPEAGQLTPNGIPDYQDASNEGPNGFLVRLLNNLDAVVTDGATSNLGVQVVSHRPLGGYRNISDLQSVLGAARYAQFKDYLTVTAWVDPKVVKPQLMDGRPHRFEDTDDAHRTGADTLLLSGVRNDPTMVNVPAPGGGGWNVDALMLSLDPGISGAGTQASPWTKTIEAANYNESVYTYPVRWERNFVYAWRQLRLAPPALEPRAPVSINTASSEVLAAVLLNLKGTYLECWDGSAGFDGGFGFNLGNAAYAYPYPAQETEETPWYRTRVDYGMTYGSDLAGASVLDARGRARPWYGPGNYVPNGPSMPPWPSGQYGGKPVIQAAPLGRLRESTPISRDQARAIANEVRARVAVSPFRSWMDFNAFVDKLPVWEDVNNDLTLDSGTYTVAGSAGPYARRMYQREDLNSDGVMNRQVFTVYSGSWAVGDIAWMDRRTSALASGDVPGLTFAQKDVIKAMANPNTDLNDFNPDANRWKEVDKTDIGGLGSESPTPGIFQADPSGYVHTTEFSLDPMGYCRVFSVGRVLSAGGRILAQRQEGVLARTQEIYRDTTQADFMKAYAGGAAIDAIFEGGWPGKSPYPLAGGQSLVSYPEPQTTAGGGRAADADYDGQVGLGFIGCRPGPDDRLLGDLFDTADAALLAPAATAQGDLRGPTHERLILPATAASDAGAVFPDGVYSEKDCTLKYLKQGSVTATSNTLDYIACWMKPNWFPEASPRAHTLASVACGAYPTAGFTNQNSYRIRSQDLYGGPVNDIALHPTGLFFVPGRNNFWQDTTGLYVHSPASTKGWAWPSRCLLWGTTHAFYASDTLNRRGILNTQGNWSPAAAPLPIADKPVGRLEGHRWTHVAMTYAMGGSTPCLLTLGHVSAGIGSNGGGGHNASFSDVAMSGIPPHPPSPGHPPFNPWADFHGDNTPNHLRFGEVAGEHVLNYAADATFADVRTGDVDAGSFFTDSASPGVLGRYYKEDGAAYVSSKLPAGIRPLRATWTEIPCDLWFDNVNKFAPGLPSDGWLDTLANDQFGANGKGGANGLRDVRIDLEVWDDMSTATTHDDVKLASFSDPSAANAIPAPLGRLYYKAVFVNEWEHKTRFNNPLDVTPYLDDVTIVYANPSGPVILAWGVTE